MRVKCTRCNYKAIIQSTSQESDSVKKLYCTCSNPDCGHTFVMDLSFSHTISPSAIDFPEPLLEKIKSYTPLQQRQFFENIAESMPNNI